MDIIIVDDSRISREKIRINLEKNGYNDLMLLNSAVELFDFLDIEDVLSSDRTIDLILMDIVMPDIDGIEALRRLKKIERYSHTPVIMITGITDMDTLKEAFEAGAMDYITKPIHEIELLMRVKSALALKSEMDRRLMLTLQLEEANAQLKQIAIIDALTNIPNRRQFDEILHRELERAKRYKRPISLIMADIDFFKLYNDHYGHLGGDNCLKQVAAVISKETQRKTDMPARYGGEEFAIVLPETDAAGANNLAERIKNKLIKKQILHEKSPIAGHVTMSFGIASVIPNSATKPEGLICLADNALYTAKENGRNRIELFN
ncbi:MAG: hypothetical protein A2Y40_11045 [Candidatus Margulisbacteria bacterium GWF2_35_9]|nr:MAG: hypothetical protein A2Y40_11045 [Candidatus Margulisbacteria bacterium GWF2_35_9]